MNHSVWDMDDGDFLFGTSDSMAIDSDGHMMMRMSDHMALDLDSGDIHFTSTWAIGEDDDEDY